MAFQLRFSYYTPPDSVFCNASFPSELPASLPEAPVCCSSMLPPGALICCPSLPPLEVPVCYLSTLPPGTPVCCSSTLPPGALICPPSPLPPGTPMPSPAPPPMDILPITLSSMPEPSIRVDESAFCPSSVGHFLRTVHTCYPFLFSAPAFALV